MLKLAKVPGDPIVLGHALLKTYKHLDERNMTLTHIRIMTAVMMLCSSQISIPAKDIAKLVGIPKDDLEKEMASLIASRHLHEIVPTFGDKYLYKLGAVGETFANSVRRAFESAVVGATKEAA